MKEILNNALEQLKFARIHVNSRSFRKQISLFEIDDSKDVEFNGSKSAGAYHGIIGQIDPSPSDSNWPPIYATAKCVNFWVKHGPNWMFWWGQITPTKWGRIKATNGVQLQRFFQCCSKYLVYRWATKVMQNAKNDEKWPLV
jgi:hypothetical protein